VRQFAYTAYLPGCKKTVSIKELQFGRYKHLIKAITNDSNNIIAEFFDELLIDLCPNNPAVIEYSFLDKLILLLTIRAINIAPDLELTATCPETQSTFNFTLLITDIINKIQGLNLPESIYSIIKAYNDGNLIIELGMPSIININSNDLALFETVIKKIHLNGKDVTNIKNQITEHLPITILKDIKDYINEFSKTLQDIKLLSIQSPFAKTENNIEIPLNLFSNSIIEFLKICFKRNLLSIYELEYFLLSKLHIDYELVKTSTPAELNIYINMFKEEKQEEEKTHRSNKALNPLQP
jgi:hypothetical protein